MKFYLSIFCLLPFFSLLGISCERHYQKIFAEENKGLIEVPMSDGTRYDVLTEKHAIEVDFALKWAEAIGQSLNYARLTGKKAGIVLLIKQNKEEKHLKRLDQIIQLYDLPIDVFPTFIGLR
jgi:hypothetical protein